MTFPSQKVDQAFKALLSFLTDQQGAYLEEQAHVGTLQRGNT